jgi:methylmalonyl-CoA mutase
MSDVSDELSLAAEFPPTDRNDWRKLVEAALKGCAFDKLVSKTYDGIAVEPLYERAAGAQPIAGRTAEKPWQILQRVDHPDPAAANAQALEDLENGATGLSLEFAGGVGAYGFGLRDAAPEMLAQALQDVKLNAGIGIELNPVLGSQNAGINFAELLKQRGIAPSAVDVRFNYQPLSTMAVRGGALATWHEIAPPFANMIRDLQTRGFKGPFAVTNGVVVHDAGGSEAQELAFALATAVEYLRALEASGMPLERASAAISFRLAADANELLTLAKFRALRKLWARVEETSGLSPKPAFVTGVTAWRMMTARDVHVNMLRATLAVTAAGLGGADAICVLPFTAALGLPDAFARRVARNLQLISLEESNLYRVADPAAGSGGIEALTKQLAERAWALLQEIEVVGGAAVALEQGLIQKKVAATRAARQAAVARGKDAITGVSDYPNLGELPVKTLSVVPAAAPPVGSAIMFDALPPIRLAEPFEILRDSSDAMLAKSGARPKVFLANLGKLSEFNARAMFAKNFYEAGGIEEVTNDGFKSFADLVAAFKASGAKLACLCSSDKVYETQAAEAAAALKAAGAIVHLAGRPGEHEEAWNKAGVSTYIYVGCDVLSTLRAAHVMIAKS